MTDSACFINRDILRPGEGSAGRGTNRPKNGTSRQKRDAWQLYP